jgi:hypothetical protein
MRLGAIFPAVDRSSTTSPDLSFDSTRHIRRTVLAAWLTSGRKTNGRVSRRRGYDGLGKPPANASYALRHTSNGDVLDLGAAVVNDRIAERRRRTAARWQGAEGDCPRADRHFADRVRTIGWGGGDVSHHGAGVGCRHGHTGADRCSPGIIDGPSEGSDLRTGAPARAATGHADDNDQDARAKPTKVHVRRNVRACVTQCQPRVGETRDSMELKSTPPVLPSPCESCHLWRLLRRGKRSESAGGNLPSQSFWRNNDDPSTGGAAAASAWTFVAVVFLSPNQVRFFNNARPRHSLRV